MEEFLRWAATKGVSDGPHNKFQSSSCLGYSLLLSDFPDAGGRGLAAARDLEKGEIILKVPKNALMSRESVMADGGQLAKCLGRNPNLSSTQVLVIYLLREVAKRKKSFWHPYLLQLPRNYDILASFNGFEVEALQVDDAMLVAQRASGNVHQEWKESQVLMNEMGMKQRFTNLKSWLWAFAAVSFFSYVACSMGCCWLFMSSGRLV